MEISLSGLRAAPNPRRLVSRPTGRWRGRPSAAAESEEELRVCVNRTCGRQGSREILEVLAALAPPPLSVASCGCLGRCGAGPNLAVLPRGAIISHCSTPARAAQLLADLRGPGFDPERSLDALALRKRAEGELDNGNATNADALLTQAIELNPSGGQQYIYRSRSVARLTMGNYAGALEDAEEALKIDPKYPLAYLSQGDAFLAMGECSAAEKAYSNALLIDPSIRRSKSFKARVAKLQAKLVTSDASS